ncbi:hypothetical protein D3C80_250260 [compost metagenome]
MALTLRLFDRFANCAGFFFRIPCGMDFYFRIVGVRGFREQRLTEATFVMRDQMGGCTQNMCGRAVVALKLNDHCARKILVKAENIIHFRTAPAIDGLIVITDAAQIDFVVARAEFAMLTGSAY